MDTNRIQYLLKKYLTNECSLKEKKELNLLINSLRDSELKAEFRSLWNVYSSDASLSEEDSQLMLSAILSDKRKSQKPTLRRKPARFIPFRAISVAASLLVLISLGIYIRKEGNLDASKPFIAKALIVSPAQPTSYIRHLTLSDGTGVILKTGSTLYYPKVFVGKTREVILKGEAYFDVKHMDTKPFIIHTGSVKTTVLGTAFDIKAWPEQKNVIVSVTRGKVRVENDKKVLAVLTLNESMDYNYANVDAKLQTVDAEEVVNSWTKEDLIFNRIPFKSIALVLSKRYGKDININNVQLANTLITTSFSGTESLENILDVLCTINSNTRFEINARDVRIVNNNYTE